MALFIDIKEAFDYVLKIKLVERIMELVINGDLICWTQFFFIDQRVQLVIIKHTNREQDIEIRILKRSSVLPILF